MAGVARPVLMVNMQPGESNASLVQVAAGLAAQSDAIVVGVAAWQPMPVDWTGGDYIASNFTRPERTETEAAMREVEADFHAAFHGPDCKWRSSVSFASPFRYIVKQVRHADWVLTGTPPLDGSDAVRAMAGDLVMQCGRPVLIVPNALEITCLAQIMLAWKETPEGRRAALDALPLLQRAAQVTVVEISAKNDLSSARQHLADVSCWLSRRGIIAETLAVAALHDSASQNDDGEQLESVARRLGANLTSPAPTGIAGCGSGHSAASPAPLIHGDRCALLSH